MYQLRWTHPFVRPQEFFLLLPARPPSSPSPPSPPSPLVTSLLNPVTSLLTPVTPCYTPVTPYYNSLAPCYPPFPPCYTLVTPMLYPVTSALHRCLDTKSKYLCPCPSLLLLHKIMVYTVNKLSCS